jgi:hypothetical protein
MRNTRPPHLAEYRREALSLMRFGSGTPGPSADEAGLRPNERPGAPPTASTLPSRWANVRIQWIADAPADARWVIYTRTASRARPAGGSVALAAQEETCRRSIEALDGGAQVVEVIREVGSGDGLPGLRRILDLINSGGADAIMTMHLDRISRNDATARGLVEELERANAPLYIAHGTKPGSRVSLPTMDTLFAGPERERALVALRTRQGSNWRG